MTRLNCWPAFVGFILGSLLYAATHEANAAIYCYPYGMTTVCFSDDGRSFSDRDNVKNPNIIITPPIAQPYQYPAYIPDRRNVVPEQDFSQCTLALGCIRGTR